MNVHRFDTSGAAYNQSQTDDSIRDGDILLVAPEGRVAVLVEAWPVIVVGPAGDEAGYAFHAMNDGLTWDTFRDGQYAGSAAAARKLL